MADEPKAGASTPAGGDPQPGVGDKTPKFEVKDGIMTVDGRKIVYEADLIAAKKSLEQQIEQQQSVHVAAIDKAKIDLSDAQTKLAATSADVTRLTQEVKQARESGADPKELARLKQELDAAKSGSGTSETKVLELRRELIRARYPALTEEQVKDKTSVQLDALEEALKAVAGSRGGPGNYALGGGGGNTTPLDPLDRAKKLIEATPYRGVRNPPAAQ